MIRLIEQDVHFAYSILKVFYVNVFRIFNFGFDAFWE